MTNDIYNKLENNNIQTFVFCFAESYLQIIKISSYSFFNHAIETLKSYFRAPEFRNMSNNLSTFGKICIHVGFCVFIVFFFGRNTVLRLPSCGAMYKEYVTGLLPLVLFYGNMFLLFPHLFLKERLFAYIGSVTLCLLAATCAELAWVYPQIAPSLVSLFGAESSKYLIVYYFPLVFFRNTGFILFSFAFCDIRHQTTLKKKYESRLKEIAGEVDILKTDNTPVFANINDILYCQQGKNFSWVFMAGGNFYIRYGSLKKLKNLLGENLLIDVSKGLFVMLDKIHSYDEASITIRDSVQDKLHPFEWGTGYYENARWKLSVSPSQETRETFLKNSSEKATNAPLTLESKKHLNAVFRLHPNFRPVYSYIRLHPGCKANDISSKHTIPTGSLNRILKLLKDEGLIEYAGSKKTSGYRVRQQPSSES